MNDKVEVLFVREHGADYKPYILSVFVRAGDIVSNRSCVYRNDATNARDLFDLVGSTTAWGVTAPEVAELIRQSIQALDKS